MRGSGAAMSADKSPPPLYMDPGQYVNPGVGNIRGYHPGQCKKPVKYMDPGEYVQPGQYKESSLGRYKDKDYTSNNCFSTKRRISAIAVAVLAVIVLVVGIIVFKNEERNEITTSENSEKIDMYGQYDFDEEEGQKSKDKKPQQVRREGIFQDCGGDDAVTISVTEGGVVHALTVHGNLSEQKIVFPEKQIHLNMTVEDCSKTTPRHKLIICAISVAVLAVLVLVVGIIVFKKCAERKYEKDTPKETSEMNDMYGQYDFDEDDGTVVRLGSVWVTDKSPQYGETEQAQYGETGCPGS